MLAGTEAALAATMFSLVTAEIGKPPNPEASKQLKALCTGIAKAIVPHIVANAQVAPGIPITPVTGPTIGPGTIL